MFRSCQSEEILFLSGEGFSLLLTETLIQNVILFTGLVDFVEINFKNPTRHPLVDSHRWLLLSALLILR